MTDRILDVPAVRDGWTLTQEDDDKYTKAKVFRLDAPLWHYRVSLVRADPYMVRDCANRMQEAIVDDILNNPPVKEEVNRLYVAKEKIREILYSWRPTASVDYDVMKRLERLLHEEET